MQNVMIYRKNLEGLVSDQASFLAEIFSLPEEIRFRLLSWQMCMVLNDRVFFLGCRNCTTFICHSKRKRMSFARLVAFYPH